MYFSARPDSTWARWLCYQSVVIMIIIQLVCGANTIVGIVSRNGIFVLEKFMMPKQWGMMTHFAFRWAACTLRALVFKQLLNAFLRLPQFSQACPQEAG